jgi:plastocyanin
MMDPRAAADITEPNDAAESADPNDAADPTEKADAADPTEPIERTDPTEPIESSEPFDPIESSESSDHTERVESASAMAPVWHLGYACPTSGGIEGSSRQPERRGARMRRGFASARNRGVVVGLVAATAFMCAPSIASAGTEVPPTADYQDRTTFNCRYGPIEIHPGQNLNLFGSVPSACPNAEKVGDGPAPTSVFDEGSGAAGYITRFKPSMVEIKPGGRLVTPSVWDLHLHHVVWLLPEGNVRMASGEEKTHVRLPQGYGAHVTASANWSMNYMIHALTASSGRDVYLTWQIDWVPETEPNINPITMQWLDVAGPPQIYPVFDAERGYDTNGDDRFSFPDEATDPSDPAYAEENEKISNSSRWTVPAGGRTLLGGTGHLHPGGLRVNLEVARDGPDAGTVDGDDPSEVKPLFRSDAHYYEPAGAVSWDVSMETTRPEWRISLKAGDTLSIDAIYDIKRASWYEAMGILPLALTTLDDPLAKDPFDDAADVQEMYEAGGILTHGRLPENIDKKARDNLKLPDPRKLKSKGRIRPSGINISSFSYRLGGYAAAKGIPNRLLRPPVIGPGKTVLFTNLDAQPGMADEDQVWHSITSCKAPCNKGSGIGYPLANGPVKFDSGQLGFGTGGSSEVTTGTDEFRTPPISKAGTYTYFCRIHPFMRGSFRVKKPRR